MNDAASRFAAWKNVPWQGLGALIPAKDTEAVRAATDEHGKWKGNAVFLSERSGWTIIEDLSGCLSCIPPTSWLRFAGNTELVFAGYNDSIEYGEVVVISSGAVQTYFVQGTQPSIDNASAPYSPGQFSNWTDVARFVDEDELAYSDSGHVWVF